MLITMTFDTKTKDLAIDMGGKTMKNVEAVHVYHYGTDPDIEIITVNENKDEETRTYTRVTADQDEILEKEQHSKLPSFFLLDKI